MLSQVLGTQTFVSGEESTKISILASGAPEELEDDDELLLEEPPEDDDDDEEELLPLELPPEELVDEELPVSNSEPEEPLTPPEELLDEELVSSKASEDPDSTSASEPGAGTVKLSLPLQAIRPIEKIPAKIILLYILFLLQT